MEDLQKNSKECNCDELQNYVPPWAGKNCYIIITGANRGFGKALCVEFVNTLTHGPHHAFSVTLLLVCRDIDAANVICNQIMEQCQSSPTKLRVLPSLIPVDLAVVNEEILSTAVKPIIDMQRSCTSPQWNLLIHNAGSLGSISSTIDKHVDVVELNAYYTSNLTSMILLTSIVLRCFAPASPHAPITIINISSLAGHKPFPKMSNYCVSKAARVMYLKCLAVDRPSVAVFNYSPGPLETDMFNSLIESHGDADYRTTCSKMKESGQLISPHLSAKVCIKWLKRQLINLDENGSVSTRAQLLQCPIHDRKYIHVWEGEPLDFYEATKLN